MKRLVLAIVVTAVSAGSVMPEALAFQPGEHVRVVSVNQAGTVIEEKGNLVKVHLDGSGYSADVGVWYDKNEHQVVGGAASTTSTPSNSSATSQNGSNAASGAGPYQQGKRIQVGKQTGTVLEDKGDIVKIHIDGSGYSPDVGVWFEKAKLKSGDVPGNAAFNAGGTQGGVPLGAIGGTKPSPTHNVGGGNLNTNTRTPGNLATGNFPNTAEAADKAVGAPPDGIYTCNKISGRSYIHIGTIEIRGRTYKGFSSQQGSFHPFTMDASGGIVFTAGLTSLPDGWTLKPAKYVGPDYKGHPLIRVYYTSARGAAEVIDATKEK